MADKLVIVIATTGRSKLLERTLTSLAACQKPDIYVETIVVENGDKGSTETIVRSFQSSLNARFLYFPEPSKCGALNFALTHIEDSLVVFSDDDIRFHPNVLCAYAQAAENTVSNEFYGGPFDVDYDTRPAEWLLPFLPRSAGGWQPSQHELASQQMKFLGFNWAAFSNDLRNAGGFDEHIGPGSDSGVGDEGDMQNSLLAHGAKIVYVPGAKVWHYVPVDRCSDEWILQRAFRTGLYGGITHADKTPGSRRVPLWILRRLTANGLRLATLGVLGSGRVRFDARYRFQKSLGLLRGWTSRTRETR